jgi:hypothetical protein
MTASHSTMSDPSVLNLNIHRREEFLRHSVQSADQNLNLVLLVETRAVHFFPQLFGVLVFFVPKQIAPCPPSPPQVMKI